MKVFRISYCAESFFIQILEGGRNSKKEQIKQVIQPLRLVEFMNGKSCIPVLITPREGNQRSF